MNAPTFNLLPESERRGVRRTFIVRMARDAAILFFLCFVLATATLGVARAWLHRSADQEEANVAVLVSRVTPGDAQTLAKDIEAFNASLATIDVLQQSYTKWSAILERFFATLPARCTLTSLTVRKSDAAITASGVAATREDFQAILEAFTPAQGFKDTTIPTPDLLERTNIPFSIVTHFMP